MPWPHTSTIFFHTYVFLSSACCIMCQRLHTVARVHCNAFEFLFSFFPQQSCRWRKLLPQERWITFVLSFYWINFNLPSLFSIQKAEEIGIDAIILYRNDVPAQVQILIRLCLTHFTVTGSSFCSGTLTWTLSESTDRERQVFPKRISKRFNKGQFCELLNLFYFVIVTQSIIWEKSVVQPTGWLIW